MVKSIEDDTGNGMIEIGNTLRIQTLKRDQRTQEAAVAEVLPSFRSKGEDGYEKICGDRPADPEASDPGHS